MSKSFHDFGRARASGAIPETQGDRPGREECDARAPIHFIGTESQFEGSSASSAVAHRPIRVAARLLDLETPQALGYICTMVITSSAKAGINMITAIYDWHVTATQGGVGRQ